jgi:plasmid stabilization system protein ParE
MAYPIKIHKAAHKEYIEAYEWYELEQEGLGARFMNVVEKRIWQIRETPEYYSHVYKSYRQVSTDDFPFTIVFQFFPERNLVHISSIFHNSRNPRKKYRKEV